MALIAAAAVASLGPQALWELLAGVTFVRPPAACIPAPELYVEPELQTRLDSLSGTLPHGRLGAVVVDLRSGGMASLDSQRPFPAASLFKLPLLLTVLAEEDAGRLDADTRLEIRPEDWTDGSGVLQARVGERLSVRELSRLMIQNSDNIAALVLLDAVGAPAVNATAKRLGLQATHVVDHRGGEDGEHVTSAADVARLLVAIATGQFVSPHISEEALRHLELKQAVAWLADDLPFWVKVAHKWGDLPQARHDAGVVFSPRGSYVVVVLTEGSRPEESASAIARAARLAFDYQATGRGFLKGLTGAACPQGSRSGRA